jgi:hypothetical protein
MNYVVNTGCGLPELSQPEFGLPDAKGAKVSRRTLKNTEMNTKFRNEILIPLIFMDFWGSFLNFFGFLSRPSRNLSVLRVQQSPPSFLRAASPL